MEAGIEFQCPESETGEEPFWAAVLWTPTLTLNASGMPKVDRLMPSSDKLHNTIHLFNT